METLQSPKLDIVQITTRSRGARIFISIFITEIFVIPN